MPAVGWLVVLCWIGARLVPAGRLVGRLVLDRAAARRAFRGPIQHKRVAIHVRGRLASLLGSAVVGKTTGAYRPSGRLVRLLAARDQTCTFPGCHRRVTTTSAATPHFRKVRRSIESAKGERVGMNSSIQELDFECMLLHIAGLADQLVQARLCDHTLAFRVDRKSVV